MASYILIISCPDRIGIVATVSTFLAVQQCNILDSAQFGDPDTGRFFLRVHFQTINDAPSRRQLHDMFAGVAAPFHMDWHLYDAGRQDRLLVMVSKYGHCLNDLLFRCEVGGMPAQIAAVVSNHEDMRQVAEHRGVPYYCLPVTRENKAEQEAALRAIMEEQRIDTVVLARYMQILSSDFCADHEGRIINIHHSFLPSFKGAKPYRQAYQRGVKLIGATAHYVTASLDEGPIIEQDVARVDHACSPDDLTATGRDVESLVLARAVKAHTEHRVLLNGGKTVVFRQGC